MPYCNHGSATTFKALSCVTRSSLVKPLALFALKLAQIYSFSSALSVLHATFRNIVKLLKTNVR